LDNEWVKIPAPFSVKGSLSVVNQR